MRNPTRRPLTAAGIWLGLGLGGFFDGIVFHQILRWHHMLTSAGYPPTSVANLDLNTLADGLFHAATYFFTLVGLIVLWRASTRKAIAWSARVLIGAILIGWGAFNLARYSSGTAYFLLAIVLRICYAHLPQAWSASPIALVTVSTTCCSSNGFLRNPIARQPWLSSAPAIALITITGIAR